MSPRQTAGASHGQTEFAASNNYASGDFDTTTQEYLEFSFVFPKRWNKSTITFQPYWSHAATTVNFGVVWQLAAVAISDSDPLSVAKGTVQTSTDTGGTTDDLFIGPESAAITVAGTPANADLVNFAVSRVVGNASDTLAVDARLYGIMLYWTTNAENDT
jgi:hypothetical protein